MPKIPIRPIRIKGNVAYVPLTKGYEAVIDAADVHLVEGVNWKCHVTPHTVYAERSLVRDKKKRTIRMHRAIMGDPHGFEVDHEDGNGLNNRRKNLRQATSSQNKHNARIRSDNTSGFKGVRWHEIGKKWKASIKVNGKDKYLGLFSTPEEAHAAYTKASAELHGEFGRTQ